MWSLKASLTKRGDDEGMILLWVGLSMTVLLGVGALTIDLGALYVERRQLQNGADAAALAIAYNCATGDTCGSVMTTATKLADDNSNDHASAVPLVCGVGPGLSAGGCSTPAGLDGATNWVQVFTSTESAGGGNQVPMLLAPLVGAVSGKTVNANSVAQWGGLQSAKVSPIVIPACEYTKLGGTLDGSSFPSGSTTIYFHSFGAPPPDEAGVEPCSPSTSGATFPGGFGWLGSSNCTADVSAGAWYAAYTASNVAPGCRARNLRTGPDLVLALYDNTSGGVSDGQYHLLGFVGFKVTAVNFGGNNRSPRRFRCPLTPDDSGLCIQGTFTKTTKSGGVPGGPNLGVTAIKLIG
ncbi:MAG TPA: pilus assembly protein TadG-related protein [Ilumatobacteraceae bacterium]|nr:pilus assembly protein TadG-related protein [Ilumatobacteraceae bacterium]